MSLYSTTTSIKKILMWGGIIIGAIIFINIFIGFVKLLIPKKQPPPTVAFGKLQAIPFPVSATTDKITYTLENDTGQPPAFADRINVYKIQDEQPDLIALDNAKALISKDQDFLQVNPTPITDVLFQWQSPLPPYKVLSYNIFTLDFTMTSSYTTDPSIIAATNLGDQPTAIDTAKSFLSGLNAYPSDIDETKIQTSLYSINGTTKQLQPAISLSTAQVIGVDYFQNDVNKMSLYYPHPPHSTINVLVAGGDSSQQVVEAHYTHKTILTDSQATYPLKTGTQAWKELQQGKAYIASQASPPTDNVIIRNISLGYYVGENPQAYLMPIVVFQGDNGFYAYVSAVADQWIQK